MNPTAVTFDALHVFTAEAFRRTGVSEADSATGADVLATTDDRLFHRASRVASNIRVVRLLDLIQEIAP